MILLFLDGPIAGETITNRDAPPRYSVMVPKRITVCDCSPNDYLDEHDYLNEHIKEAGTVEYFRVAVGQTVGIYSLHDNDEKAIVNALKTWRFSDFAIPTWYTNCRSRRAFA